MHVHCTGPCRMAKSVLRVNVHTVCHVHVACSCHCPRCMFMSLSMLHVHVNAAFHVNPALHVNASFHVNAAFHDNASCPHLCPCTYVYVEMPECRTVRHPVSPVPDRKKITIPEQIRYRTKLRDAGMLMPALVSLMPMPSYAELRVNTVLL
jgi:hypothetical protein